MGSGARYLQRLLLLLQPLSEEPAPPLHPFLAPSSLSSFTLQTISTGTATLRQLFQPAISQFQGLPWFWAQQLQQAAQASSLMVKFKQPNLPDGPARLN